MTEKVRSFMIARFKELAKTKKIVRVVKLTPGDLKIVAKNDKPQILVEVQFEGKVALRLNPMEAEVLQKEIERLSAPVNLNPVIPNSGKK